MAIEDRMKRQEEEVEQEDREANLTDEEEQDLRIAVMMGEGMLEEGGYEVLQTAIDQSSDPSQVIGQFFIQLIQQLMEETPEDVQLSPNIFLAEGGFVEQLMDIAAEELDMDDEVQRRAEIYIGTTIQEMAAKSAQAQGQLPPDAPQPTAPAGPALPQGAV